MIVLLMNTIGLAADWARIAAREGLATVGHARYFGPSAIEQWLKAWRLATNQTFTRRELWSILQDSKISSFMPGSVCASIETNWLMNQITEGPLNHRYGGWQLLKFEKR